MNLPISVQDFQQYFIKFESEHRDLINHDIRLVLSLKEEKNEFIFDYLRRSSEAQIVDNLKTIMWVTLNNCPTY
jgi:hypothetical protein